MIEELCICKLNELDAANHSFIHYMHQLKYTDEPPRVGMTRRRPKFSPVLLKGSSSSIM